MTVLGLCIGIIISIVSYAKGEISRKYAINTSIAVTSVTEDGLFTTKSSNPNSVDIYLAENMVDSVIYVLKSDKLLKDAVTRAGLVGVSTSDIASNLHMQQYNKTQIIEMTLYWRTAEEGVQILNAINQTAPGELIETLKIGGVSVVNAPTARYRIGGSVNAKLWFIMAIVGAAVGCGICVLQMLIFPTLLDPKDMERNMGVFVLGEIPDQIRQKGETLLLDPKADRHDVVNESFYSAAHALQNMMGMEGHKIIYVTSSTENEGKTFVAANLALHLSDMGKKVLLIDFDVRNPSVGSMFLKKVHYSRSINALYRGDATVEEAVTTLTGYLDILPAILERRTLPLDDAMMDLVKTFLKRYDYILMDTAPVGLVSDPMWLNAVTNDVIFVVKYDATRISTIQESMKKLDKSGARIVGCIVNCVRKVKSKQYYDYGYGYGSGRSREFPDRKPTPAEEDAQTVNEI